jgi:hypothetical protein
MNRRTWGSWRTLGVICLKCKTATGQLGPTAASPARESIGAKSPAHWNLTLCATFLHGQGRNLLTGIRSR